MLGRAREQRQLDLVGHQRRTGGGEARGPGQLPAVVVRDAHVTGASGGLDPLEGVEGLLQRHVGVEGVDEEQVDVVGAEPGERGVERVEQAAAGGVDHPLVVLPAQPGLGAEHDVGPGDDVAEEGAEELLAGAAAVGARGVDQRAAGLDEVGQLLARLVLVGVAAPHHRAEPEAGDAQAAAAHPTLLHGRQGRGRGGSLLCTPCDWD